MNLESKVLQFHYPDVGQKEHHHPDEDFIWVKDNAFAVFDGVTLAHQDPYPNPSPAAKTAEIGAKTVIETVDSPEVEEKDGLIILQTAFDRANSAIRKLNLDQGVTPETVDHLDRKSVV